MQCSYDIEFVQRLLYSGSCLWCLCTSECRYGMFVCTWTWQGDLLRGTWWHWWCASQLSAYTVQIYEHYSTTLLIYLFISNFIFYLKFASKMFIYSVKIMMTVLLGKRCATIVTWYYAIVDIVSPFRGNFNDL